MNRKFLYILLFLLTNLMSISVFAQQDPQFTQYTLNPLAVNSAYAGSRGYASVIGLHRNQWVGQQGAPITNTLSVDMPLGNRVGIGASFISDELGPSQELYVDLNFSYTIPVTDTYFLSFGLKGGMRRFNLDFTKGDRFTQSDVVFNNNSSRIFPTAGMGLFLRDKRSYIGISVPNFFRVDHYDHQLTQVAQERLHLFLVGGWVFDVSSNVKFKPAFLLKHVNGAPLSLDVSVNFMIHQKFRAGVSWRWDDSISGILGYQVRNNLLVSYAYDATTTPLRQYNNGTHEIAVRLDFLRRKILKSPRFF